MQFASLRHSGSYTNSANVVVVWTKQSISAVLPFSCNRNSGVGYSPLRWQNDSHLFVAQSVHLSKWSDSRKILPDAHTFGQITANFKYHLKHGVLVTRKTIHSSVVSEFSFRSVTYPIFWLSVIAKMKMFEYRVIPLFCNSEHLGKKESVAFDVLLWENIGCNRCPTSVDGFVFLMGSYCSYDFQKQNCPSTV